MPSRHMVPPHPIEHTANICSEAGSGTLTSTNNKLWGGTPRSHQEEELVQVDVDLDELISTPQVGPKEQKQMV